MGKEVGFEPIGGGGPPDEPDPPSKPEPEKPKPKPEPGPGEAPPTEQERRQAEQFLKEAREKEQPPPEPPADAEVVERGASGKPTVLQKGKERYYTPESTMFKLGYRTRSEYSRAQQTGKHPGRVAVKDFTGQTIHIWREDLSEEGWFVDLLDV